MDKKKQIEESKSCYSCNHYYACEDCYKALTRSNDYFKKHIAHNREIAMHCKCYQPKIPENAVVLVDEKDIQQYEWSKLIDKMGVIKFGEKLRKETAKEIYKKLYNFSKRASCGALNTTDIKQIAKDDGVEVE